MKAYEVSYETAGKSAMDIVLTENESTLEESLALKDKNFKIGQIYSRVISKREVPLSTVKVVDLSVAELLSLFNR
jgi:hypothetical protein